VAREPREAVPERHDIPGVRDAKARRTSSPYLSVDEKKAPAASKGGG